MSDSPVLVICIIIIAALLLFLGVCELFYLDITGLGCVEKALREFPEAAKKIWIYPPKKPILQALRHLYRHL